MVTYQRFNKNDQLTEACVAHNGYMKEGYDVTMDVFGDELVLMITDRKPKGLEMPDFLKNAIKK